MTLVVKNKTHKLKTLPEFFEAVRKGHKRFELRYNDRNYIVGDWLVLEEWSEEEGGYTGRTLDRKIHYILENFGGIKKGWVILSI